MERHSQTWSPVTNTALVPRFSNEFTLTTAQETCYKCRFQAAGPKGLGGPGQTAASLAGFQVSLAELLRDAGRPGQLQQALLFAAMPLRASFGPRHPAGADIC